MKALILYRPESEHARAVDEFIREFSRRTNKSIQLVDVDSVDGVSKAQIYDVMEYPAVVVTQDDGSYTKVWTGLPLPLINDVAGYLVEQ